MRHSKQQIELIFENMLMNSQSFILRNLFYFKEKNESDKNGVNIIYINSMHAHRSVILHVMIF